jgi:hypothetical protein
MGEDCIAGGVAGAVEVRRFFLVVGLSGDLKSPALFLDFIFID